MPIYLYPMLVSDKVNPNILPGISRSLEKYIIINRQDELLRRLERYEMSRGGHVQKRTTSLGESFFPNSLKNFVKFSVKTGTDIDKDFESYRARKQSERMKDWDNIHTNLTKKQDDLDRQYQELQQKLDIAGTQEPEDFRKMKDILQKDFDKVKTDRDAAYKQYETDINKFYHRIDSEDSDFEKDLKRQFDLEKREEEQRIENQRWKNDQEKEQARRVHEDKWREADHQFQREKDATTREFQKERERVKAAQAKGLKARDEKFSRDMAILNDKLKQDAEKRMQQEKDRRAAAIQATVSRIDAESLALEPTTTTISDPVYGTILLGVKVIPHIVTSKIGLAELMLYDQNLKGLSKILEKMRRSITKYVLQLWNRFQQKIIPSIFRSKAKTIQQDPMYDIIYDRSSFGSRIFAVVSMTELTNGFFKTAGGITKLFGLGWKTIVIDDPIKKVVYIAPPEFKGTYSMIPYAFLYAHRGAGTIEAFNSLEDVKKTTGPLFKIKGRVKQLVKESEIYNKIDNYVTIQESTFLSEDLKSWSSKLTNDAAETMIRNIQKSALKKDLNALKSILKNIPISIPKSMDSIIEDAKKKLGSTFDSNYKFSYNVIKNSVENHPDDLIKMLAMTISSLSLLSKDSKKEMKKYLIKSINLLESPMNDNTSNDKITGEKDLFFKYVYTISVITSTTIIVTFATISGILITSSATLFFIFILLLTALLFSTYSLYNKLGDKLNG